MDYLDFEKPLMEIEQHIAQLKEKAKTENMDFSDIIKQLEVEVLQKKKKLFENLEPYQRLKIARHPKRPLAADYIKLICSDFIELHGDRLFGYDTAIITGLAKIGNNPVMIVAQEKGRDTKDKLFRNFGTAHPEGYRKALRIMKTAAKFGLPIIIFIDTPGAFPGVSAEERGQAGAIAVNLKEMMYLDVPVIPIIIGEGGSGGALGVGIGDKIIMLEHAYYSVISPEGCSAILWKTQEKAADAAKSLKMNVADLLEFGIIDEAIEEPLGGAHKNPELMAKNMKKSILNSLEELKNFSKKDLLDKRYEKFRQIGVYLSDKDISSEHETQISNIEIEEEITTA